MDINRKGPVEHINSTSDDDVNVVTSPFEDNVKNITIPDISVPEFLFQAIDKNEDITQNRDWITDVATGTAYKFSDVKPMARKIASALTRLGFKKGDVLFIVTYDSALMYLVTMGVWVCGGATRPCYQHQRKETFLALMREVSTRFILCDPETSASVRWAAEQLSWKVTILSIGGEVDGALSIKEMIEDEDCSALPADLKINSKEDTCVIMNTSGSTGIPKGVMITHHSIVANLSVTMSRKMSDRAIAPSMLVPVGNYLGSVMLSALMTLTGGSSFYTAAKYDIKSLMKILQQYKPQTVFLHPFALHAFLQQPGIEDHDLTFVKALSTTGSVLSYATAKTIEAKLPHVKLAQGYGITEALFVCSTSIGPSSHTPKENSESSVAGVKFNTLQGDTHMSSGRLSPFITAKIVDPVSGQSLGRNIKGNLLIKTPCFMKGYVSNGNTKHSSLFTWRNLHTAISREKDASEILDENGWFDTGDVAYFDDEGFLYVVDRRKFTFKYQMQWVCPTEIEDIILKHPSVVSSVVVGVSNPETTSVAKAYVVLKPGSKVTEEEIASHVAEHLEEYKQLHGGVTFVESLPVTPGGKLDRPALLQRAIAESVLST